MRGLWTLFLAVGLAGCGGMIPGQIYTEQGKMLNFQIERSRGAGAVSAYDASTGEHYSGNYVALRQSVAGMSTAFVQSGNASATGTSFTGMASNMATSSAYLNGDNGSVLSCDMQIQAGLSPHGIGACTDQTGGKYRLQF